MLKCSSLPPPHITLGKYLKDCTLYVTLEPLPNVRWCFVLSQIKVVYGASDVQRFFDNGNETASIQKNHCRFRNSWQMKAAILKRFLFLEENKTNSNGQTI
jgi:tRNA(Arg) A34 adenosine deaminase TadA